MKLLSNFEFIEDCQIAIAEKLAQTKKQVFER